MLQRSATSWRPALVPVFRPRVLAQATAPRPSASPAILALGHTIGLGIGAATAWVGFDTGARRSGLLSILGYVIGVGGALSAVIDAVVLARLGYQAAAGTAPAAAPSTNAPLM